METLRQLWNESGTTLGGWVSVPSSVTAEAVARAGFDYVCIDAQHGAVEYSDCVSMIQAVLLGGGRPIVRVPWNEPGIIGKMLDAGAQGVIIPMVNTVAEAEAAVRACRYAPEGARSSGPTLVGPRTDRPYFEWAKDNVACIPMIETIEAVGNLGDILAVPGIDAVYVGPSDLSITLGLGPGNHDEAPEFLEALDAIAAGCEAHGIVAGIHATGALTPDRLERGYRMITVTGDLQAMKLGMASELDRARGNDVDGSSGSMY
ncbi:MAG: aldolase/citrate lyase family protein [Ilumatobacter sp.]|jgi:4-hydroxy-2-oxoheptanedioate aldolase|uniref:HpcH/HpaI aldolase family protein n=1 Tax=uncultured Ilumatobacter sp. TaxID=879968 RepID=UPI003590BB40|tara:strand:- start:820 stop:1602 length:783 start_codon:yes stop_codon:yes gene_type:complete